MNKKQETENKVKKIIPSKLETGFQQLLYKTIGKNIPKTMTPNQVTLIGGIPMYYEMTRLQIQLFKRLSLQDKEGK